MDLPLACSHNCNPDTGGKPLCKLGIITQPWNGERYAKTVQLRGASATEVLNKQRDDVEREYDMFIIGEAPGKQEDREGIPFIGDAGDILSKFITQSQLDPDRIYCTNIAKCRPPKNRKPSAKELKACRQHILEEFEKHKPRVVMLLGNSAMYLFQLHKLGGVGKIHGKLFERTIPKWEDSPTYRVIPTYHPAAFIHRPNPKLQRRVLDDFVFAREVLKAAPDQKVIKPFYTPEYEVVTDLKRAREVVDEIKANGIFSYDTESPNAKYMVSPLMTLGFSIGEGRNFIFPFFRHDPRTDTSIEEFKDNYRWRPQWSAGDLLELKEMLRELFEDPNIPKIAHNIKYDNNVVRKWLGVIVQGWLWDTMIMHHLLFEQPPHDLASLCDMEFGFGDYEQLVREITGHGKKLKVTYDHIPDDLLFPYLATDCEGSYRLAQVYYQELKAQPELMELYKEESHGAIRAFGKAEYNGCFLNVPVVEELEQRFDDKLKYHEQECRNLSKPDFNPGSHKQVQELFIELGMSKFIEKPETSSGYSTAKDILTEIEHPLAQNVLLYRHYQKMNSTYVENALADLDPDGMLRYPFWLHGTVSGRVSNRWFHQIPRFSAKEIEAGVVMRDMVAAPPGWEFFYADYSQIELRVFAYLTGEEELIKVLEEDGDVHRLTAAGALGVDFEQVSDFNRNAVGKPLNFGVIYGSEGYQIAKLEYEDPRTGRLRIVGLDMAQRFVRNFRERYGKVDTYLTYVPDLARINSGVVKSVLGRQLHVAGLNDGDQYRRGKAERQATNFTVQSPAGGICIRTCNMINEVLEEHNVGEDLVKFALSVHDSCMYMVRPEIRDWFAETFKTVAARPIPQLNNASFPAKIGIGSTWARAENNA